MIEPLALEQVQEKIIQSVLHLDVQKGHLKWTVQQVSANAGCSRSLVYYHFGRTKKKILLNCLELLSLEFYGFTSERQSLPIVSLVESLCQTHRLYQSTPNIAIFYQKWRHIPSEICDKYLEFENRYDAKLVRLFPKANANQRAAIHAIFHGIVTAPFITEEGIAAAVQMLNIKELC